MDPEKEETYLRTRNTGRVTLITALASEEVAAKVETVGGAVIDLTEETKSHNATHIQIAKKLLEGFDTSNQVLAKLLKKTTGAQQSPEVKGRAIRRPRDNTPESGDSSAMELDRATTEQLKELVKSRELGRIKNETDG
eukprot:gene15003-17733_t